MSPANRILGAVIAGGASRRFGSDKALAPIDGRPMLAHVADALRPQVAALVVCGRDWPDECTLPDLREGGLGPLAGLEAALAHAARQGFDAVLAVPVDTLPLPDDLVERLRGNGPAVFEHQHLIGYWPASLAAMLGRYIEAGGRSVAAWNRHAHARIVEEPAAIGNINTPADLDALDIRIPA